MFHLSAWSKFCGKGLHPLLHRGLSAAPVTETPKELLKRLRRRTGFPFIKCKDALEKFDYNFDDAEKWMHEEAVKQGWTTAGQLANRPMSQGLIGIQQVEENAVMIEVNCETDFVARNEAFHTLVSNVIYSCMEEGRRRCDRDSLVRTDLCHEEIVGFSCPSTGSRVADLVALTIGSLGENMRVRRAAFLRAPELNDYAISHYCHTTFTHPDKDKVFFGSYGSLLLLRKTSENADDLGGRNLCQHIVGMNPSKVGDPTVDKPGADKDEETVMLFQPYLLDENITVEEYSKMCGVLPIDFIRYHCGEILPGDKEL